MIPHRNENLFNAIKTHEQRLIQMNRIKEKEDLQKMKNSFSDLLKFSVEMRPQTSFIKFLNYFLSEPPNKAINKKDEEQKNKFAITINF